MNWSKEEFSAAVTAHGRSMFRAARAILDSDAAAEDAVGEAVLAAWENISRLRDRSAVRAWLVRIAVNRAYAQRRRDSRVLYLEDLPEAGAPAAGDRRYDDLWEAVRALPEDRRIAVTLFYYEDMTVEQIAKCLNVPVGTVKSRLSRAREQLKELLKED